MDNDHKKEEKPYIKEKIVRKKTSPIGVIIKTLSWIALAAIFGAVAAVSYTFIQNWMAKTRPAEEDKTTSVAQVVLPEFSTPENNTDVAMSETATEETSIIDEKQIDFDEAQKNWIKGQIDFKIKTDQLSNEDLVRIEDLLSYTAMQSQKSLVELYGYNTGESGRANISWKTIALAFYEIDESDEILLLMDTEDCKPADVVKARLNTDESREIEAYLKGRDQVYGLAVYALNKKNMTEEEIASVKVIEMGNNLTADVCDYALVIGNPYLIDGSVAVGHVSAIKKDCITVDSIYNLIVTDAVLPESCTGFMLNIKGQFVGVIKNKLRGDVLPGYGVAIGVSDIRESLNCMSSGRKISLLGVYGKNISKQLMDEGMPGGVYVTGVMENSPAYDAGISAGDIIARISQAAVSDIKSMSDILAKSHLPEETVLVEIYREVPGGYKEMTVSVKLGSR